MQRRSRGLTKANFHSQMSHINVKVTEQAKLVTTCIIKSLKYPRFMQLFCLSLVRIFSNSTPPSIVSLRSLHKFLLPAKYPLPMITPTRGRSHYNIAVSVFMNIYIYIFRTDHLSIIIFIDLQICEVCYENPNENM